MELTFGGLLKEVQNNPFDFISACPPPIAGPLAFGAVVDVNVSLGFERKIISHTQEKQLAPSHPPPPAEMHIRSSLW